MSEKRSVVFSEEYLQALKTLRKKYRRIEADVDELIDALERGETLGDRLQGTDDYLVYKARVASRDMQRGKSGGFRLLYYLQTETQTIVLTIYAKTERQDISASEVLELIRKALESLDQSDDD